MKKIMLASVVLAALFGTVSMVEAGRVDRPLSGFARCEAEGTVTRHERFRGGAIASISIQGDGDTDLDLYVYDASDRLVKKSEGSTDRESVSWFVPTTQTYRIVVYNLGEVWNRYSLATN